MSITLSRNGETLQLDSDLQWIDEFSWSRVQQAREYSLTGALLLDEGEKQSGQPITLQPSDESSAWMSRGLARQLKAWSEEAERVFTLSINGQSFDVAFRVDEDQPGVTATPVVFFSDPDDGDDFAVTLRFITV